MALNPAQIPEILRRWVKPERYKDRLGLDVACILTTLLEKDIELQGLMPWSSNYTFLTSLPVNDTEENLLAIYKPCQGERPLWDFPEGRLCQREFATYLLSEVLGWPYIPPTVLRKGGPHGQGTVQLFIESDYDIHYFKLRDDPQFTEDFRQIALFDHIVNNADRKGGHCLLDTTGQIWAIDHGLTFHRDYKLRTVIWEFCDQPIPETLRQDLERLQECLVTTAELYQTLTKLITPREVQACQNRLSLLLNKGYLPNLYHGRNVPFPPI